MSDVSAGPAEVRVYVPTPFRRLTVGAAHVAAAGATLAELIGDLEGRFPGFRDLVWADDDLLHYVNVYVNGEEVRAQAGKETALRPGDEVAFVPMLAGGQEAAARDGRIQDREPSDGAPDPLASTLTISPGHRDEMIRHAREEYPNECCGLLAGKDGRSQRLFRMTNTERSPVVYVMDPREQLQVFDRMDQDGHDLVAIYHSHTHSPAYPSPTDVRLAFYPDTAYAIVSLADQESPVVRAFRIVDKQIREIEVVVR